MRTFSRFHALCESDGQTLQAVSSSSGSESAQCHLDGFHRVVNNNRHPCGEHALGDIRFLTLPSRKDTHKALDAINNVLKRRSPCRIRFFE